MQFHKLSRATRAKFNVNLKRRIYDLFGDLVLGHVLSLSEFHAMGVVQGLW
ncbi:MAG: hypothetical protein JNK63_01360 [Chthonomonas sp.]|nr:hypothetical protein [Chthonomonas sp.]